MVDRPVEVSARAVEILHANNWEARIEEKTTDLAELSGAVNRLLDVADTSQQELRDSERRLAAQSEALTELTKATLSSTAPRVILPARTTRTISGSAWCISTLPWSPR